MIIIIICLALIGIYMAFIVAPAVLSYIKVFGSRMPDEYGDIYCSKYHMGVHSEKIERGQDFFRGKERRIIEITTDDSIMLRGDYYDCKSDKTVIFLHGYNSNRYDNMVMQGRLFYDLGFNILFTCQRGHGISGGKASSLGIKEQYDVMEWIKYVSAMSKNKEILIYGMSMGAVAVCYASDKIKDKSVKAIISDCGFISPYRQLLYDCKLRHLPGKLLVPWERLIARIFVGYDIKVPTTDSLRKTKIPILFIHGTEDRTVPVMCCREAYLMCSSEKEILCVENADHTMAFADGGRYIENKVTDYVKKYFSLNEKNGMMQNE